MIDVHDAAGFGFYAELAPPIMAKYGDEVLVANDHAMCVRLQRRCGVR